MTDASPIWQAHVLEADRRRARTDQRLSIAYGTLVVGAGAVLLLGFEVAPAQRVIAGLAALAVIALTAWRPGIGCALLALLTPLVGGLGRNVVVPLLRPSEAITGLVVFGALLHQMPDKRRRPLSGLDLVILIYGVVTVLVPALVVYFGKASTSLDVWRAIVAPLQYVTIYLLFSRLDLDDRWKRRIVNCVMVAGLVVAFVGIAQLLNVPGVRSFIGSHYVHTKAAADLCQYGICRPTSLLEHWSSYGAFAAMQFTIALALLTTRAIGFSTKWLSVVLAVNGLAVLASQTQAAVAAVVLATGLVLWYGARVPRQIIYAVFGLAIALALFWPQIQARYDQQIGQRPPAEAVGPVSNVVIPQSMQTRIRLWDEYFLPAVKHHLWWGTGTVLPPEIPDRFAKYIDNEYLRLAFRGGAAAISAHLLLLAAVAKHGARQRLQRQSLRRAVAAIALTYALIVALMGISGEYLTFLGISQTFWIMTGLLGGFLLQREPIPLTRFATMALAGERVSQPVGAVTVAPEKQVHEVAASASGARSLPAIVYRPSGSGPWSPVAGVGALEEAPLAPERLRSRPWRLRAGGLVSASALVFVGTSLGRALGFGFLIVAARLLGPSSYGLLAYALAVSNLTIVLVNNAPNALATYLARTSDTHERRRYFSNGMLFVAFMVLISLIAILPITLAARLNGWMFIGLGANLLGITAYAIYRESQRGQSRFFPMMAFYVVANFLQLASIVVLDGLGLKTPALFLFVYGSSGIAALIIMQLTKPIGLPFSRQLINRGQLRIIAAFTWPLCMQAAFWAIWFGSDLILIQWFLPARVSGHYAAAKTVANVLLLVPVAIGGVLVPHLARLEPARRIRSVIRVLIGTAVLMVPVCLVLVILRTFLIRAAFGASYAAAAGPLVWLAVAMLIDSGFLVLEATWQAIGRTRVLPVATAAAMVATASSGFVLVPRLGINGGAIAFAVGAATRFSWIGIFTIRKLSSAAASEQRYAAASLELSE